MIVAKYKRVNVLDSSRFLLNHIPEKLMHFSSLYLGINYLKIQFLKKELYGREWFDTWVKNA